MKLNGMKIVAGLALMAALVLAGTRKLGAQPRRNRRIRGKRFHKGRGWKEPGASRFRSATAHRGQY